MAFLVLDKINSTCKVLAADIAKILFGSGVRKNMFAQLYSRFKLTRTEDTVYSC